MLLGVSGLNLDYQTNSTYDFKHHSGSMGLKRKLAGTELEFDAAVAQTYVGSTAYLNEENYKLTLKREWVLPWVIRYRYSNIFSTSGFGQYKGDRQQLSLGTKFSSGQFKHSLRYRLETNDRKNLASFADYSPTRHGLRYQLGYRYRSNIGIKLSAGFRSSLYDSVPDIAVRKDQRGRVGFSTWYAPAKQLRYTLDWQYTDNQSNLTGYGYTQHKLTLSVGLFI